MKFDEIYNKFELELEEAKEDFYNTEGDIIMLNCTKKDIKNVFKIKAHSDELETVICFCEAFLACKKTARPVFVKDNNGVPCKPDYVIGTILLNTFLAVFTDNTDKHKLTSETESYVNNLKFDLLSKKDLDLNIKDLKEHFNCIYNSFDTK